ncbi:hypothetical protein [Bdellovibrio sp. HCB-110]|uniref:hypothetical protein n=1 Tax=Bdellovibrio sp. HCB-110 TaxID=3391182 RepID=UPI0039B53B3A
MARHPKASTPTLSNELIETIAQAIRVGSYVETAVALAGVSKDSFYRWLRQAESDDANEMTVKLSDAVKKALAESEKRDLDVIDKAAQEGEWTAAAWRLERKFPNKWGRQSKVQLEHTGMDGGPIEIQSMTDEEMETRIEKLLQKRTVLIED